MAPNAALTRQLLPDRGQASSELETGGQREAVLQGLVAPAHGGDVAQAECLGSVSGAEATGDVMGSSRELLYSGATILGGIRELEVFP
jgi:hypothetical protein